MSKLPSMPLLVDRYVADTRHLTLEEHGAYLLLLMHMWRQGGFLPDVDADNARLLGVTLKHWLKLKERLIPFLIAANGRLTQNRLQHQWNWAIERHNRAAERGSKGGRATRDKRKLFPVKRSTSSSYAASTSTSTSDSKGDSEGSSIQISKNNTLTSLQVAEGKLPLSRLLQTPAMRKTA